VYKATEQNLADIQFSPVAVCTPSTIIILFVKINYKYVIFYIYEKHRC